MPTKVLHSEPMAKRSDAYAKSTCVLHVRMTREELQVAHVVAKRRNIPVSVLVRELIRMESEKYALTQGERRELKNARR